MNSVRLALGLFVVFGLFHWSATVLGSDRGQHGILVGTLVVAATALAQWIAVGRRRVTLRQLGLGLPRLDGLAVAAGIATLLLLIGFLTLRINAIGLTPYPGWMALIPGLFAQAGIAEVKVIVLPEDSAFLLLVWMVASAVVPMLVFAVRGRLQEVTPLG